MIKELLDSMFGKKPLDNKTEFKLSSESYTISNELALLEYSMSICINKIANALSQCTIETYKRGVEVKEENWYKFNVEPNSNQNITDFWNKLVFEMVRNPNGALVIQSHEGDFLIADSYSIETYAFKNNIYKNICINGYNINRICKEEDVLRFKLSNKNIDILLQSVYKSYGKIVSKAIKNYNRKNSKKLFIKISALFEQFKKSVNPQTGQSEYDETLDDLFTNRLKAYFSEDDSATPIEEGLEIIDKSNENLTRSNSNETEDIRLLFDDVINFCADIFNIPRGLLKGNVADVEAMTDNFITFCINPISTLIEDEINRKLYGMKHLAENTKLKIKTSRIKGYDPTKLATSAEALYRIRVVNSNWVRKMLNEEEINEKWANEYMETKNYQTVNQHLKGGDLDGKD